MTAHENSDIWCWSDRKSVRCSACRDRIVCSGSDGSFLLTQLGAEKFYEAGSTVIALAYWNAPGTPQDVELSQVEYLQNACKWLKDKDFHPGVWGISLGGLYVLLCASLFPEIDALSRQVLYIYCFKVAALPMDFILLVSLLFLTTENRFLM